MILRNSSCDRKYNIVDSCRVWESHNEGRVRHHDGSGRNSPWAVYQVTEDSQSPAGSTESETLDEVMRRLLLTPTVPPPKAAPIPSNCELLIQRKRRVLLRSLLRNLWRDVFLVEIGTTRRTDVRSWMSHFRSCRWDGRRTGLVTIFF